MPGKLSSFEHYLQPCLLLVCTLKPEQYRCALCSCKQAKLPEVMALPAARTVKTKEERKQEKAAAAAAVAAAEKAKAAKPT
jgi:hypothetical protein